MFVCSRVYVFVPIYLVELARARSIRLFLSMSRSIDIQIPRSTNLNALIREYSNFGLCCSASVARLNVIAKRAGTERGERERERERAREHREASERDRASARDTDREREREREG